MPAIDRDPAPGKGIVLFDGDCPYCQKSVSILKRLDWLHRLHFQSARDPDQLAVLDVPLYPERLLEEMHVVPPGRNRSYAGFYAFRWIAWQLPLLMTVAPLLYLPGIPRLGQWAYLKIARNRFNLVPCEGGVCQLPLGKGQNAKIPQ